MQAKVGVKFFKKNLNKNSIFGVCVSYRLVMGRAGLVVVAKRIVKDIYEARASSEEDCELLVQKIFFKMNIVEGRASVG